MIRIITTAVIDCDHPGCTETFYDCVEMDAHVAHNLALVQKWRPVTPVLPTDTFENLKYFCPEHAKLH